MPHPKSFYRSESGQESERKDGRALGRSDTLDCAALSQPAHAFRLQGRRAEPILKRGDGVATRARAPQGACHGWQSAEALKVCMTHERRMCRSAAAFTLAELMVSLAASAVVAGSAALALRLVLESNAVVSAESSGLFSARFALDRVADRLSNATAVTVATPTRVVFTMAMADGAPPQTVEYSWSGVSDAPLEEKVGEFEPVPIASQVLAFSLEYLYDVEESIGVLDGRRVRRTQSVLNAVRVVVTVEQDGQPMTLCRDVKLWNL